MHLHLQRNVSCVSIYALLAADVARLWPDSSAGTGTPPPVWSAFFGHPRLFERHVLGIVAGLAGELLVAVQLCVCVCVCVFQGCMLSPQSIRKRSRSP